MRSFELASSIILFPVAFSFADKAYIIPLLGVCRIHNTPWELPAGQECNPLTMGLTHYSTTNDCAIYAVKGTREIPLDGVVFNANAKKEFILDLEKAVGILKDAFKDMKREALELSVISYKEVRR